ncbi:Meiotic Sister-Chromatid recombination aldehyde dehydrogenase [Serendipita sp. 398]|nr:Meiotic Sister-Chromatid recombination aldehyde dehydrogenase [Serendipita sp. 398]
MVSKTYDSGEDPWLEISPIYGLTLFIAGGIYFLFKRYQRIKYRAVPFTVKVPAAASSKWTSVVIENPSLESHLMNSSLMPTARVPLLMQGIHHPGSKKADDDTPLYITCFDPSTGYHLDTISADSEYDIAEKISLARRAWAKSRWGESTFNERKRVMRSLLRWVVKNRETCARVACRDTGKTMLDAALGEILTTCAKLEYLIDHGEAALKPESRKSAPLMFYKSSKVYYEPLGVVAAIVSWNYPFHNLISPIIAALFAGNACVVKCSEQVLWSSTWFMGAIRECLAACDLPADLVQLICCYPSEADALTMSPHIKHITFIGSETVGRKILQAASIHLTPVTLELGGKDPCVILPETDLPKWIDVWLRGSFQNCGQNCIGIERFIVHSSQHDQLVKLLTEKTKKLRFGPALAEGSNDGGYVAPVDCGSMISRHRFGDLERVIQEAEEEGATVFLGGHPWKHPYVEEGMYFEGTVVANVSPSMEIAQHELFAPVITVMPYNTVEDAIAIANGTPITVDRWPWLIQTSIPAPLQYPIRSVVKSWDFLSGMIQLFWGESIGERTSGVFQIIKASR